MAEERGKKPRNDDAIADEDSEIFPSRVMELILMKLPVKSLARFKAVSKSWAETISSPQFNIRRWKSRPDTECIVWGWQPHSDAFSLMRLDLSRNKFSIDPSEYGLESPALPLCSSNGVLLLKCFTGDEVTYSLVNPTLRSESEVIKIVSLPRVEDFAVNHGHYYDSRADDYRVAVISRIGSGEEYLSLYSCRHRLWNLKTPLRVEGINHERGLFVNGCFYWWVREERTLVGLNVREGTVGVSGGPAALRSEVDLNDKINLTDVTGRLGLFCKDRELTRFRVWVMEKEEVEGCFGVWRELMNIKENEQVSPLSCLGEEDRVVCTTDGRLKRTSFFVFDDKSKCYEEIVCRYLADPQWHNLIPHSETLFSLRRFLQKKNSAGNSGLWSQTRNR